MWKYKTFIKVLEMLVYLAILTNRRNPQAAQLNQLSDYYTSSTKYEFISGQQGDIAPVREDIPVEYEDNRLQFLPNKIFLKSLYSRNKRETHSGANGVDREPKQTITSSTVERTGNIEVCH